MKNHRAIRVLQGTAVGIAALLAGASAQAQEAAAGYEVTITNLTVGTTFTPPIVIVHGKTASVFKPGQPASPELAALAEAGDTQPLNNALGAATQVDAITTATDPIGPGQSATLTVSAGSGFERITVAGMLIPTNDGFFAVNGEALPENAGETVTYTVPAYDAGSEPNDESCANIPGPTCGGAGLSEDAGGEGYVYIHPGIHGVGDLSAAERDWRNPVAWVSIRGTSGNQ